MNYKDELRKMKKHRKKYFPVMEKLLAMYDDTKNNPAHVEFTDLDEMFIILELLNLRYLDAESFIVVKNFNDVTRIIYNGRYPLTDAGHGALGR